MSTRRMRMIPGHTCKVRSTKATCVSKEYYEHFKSIVACHEFECAIEQAKKQLLEEEFHEQKRVYQNEFSLPMKRNIFGLLTIPIMVNNETLQFIIDTGAQMSGIKECVAKRLALPKTKGSVQIGSIGGMNKALAGVMANTLQLGAIEYHQFPLIQLDQRDFSIRFGSFDILGFDGIIGWDMLRQLDFELDDIKKRFIVLKNRLHIPYPNMIKGSFPCFIVTLPDQGHAIYGFDSGSKMSWIGEEAIQLHHLPLAGEVNSVGFGVHGMEKIPMKIVESCTLYIDKARIDMRHVMSGRVNLFPTFQFDGILGNEICKGRRMRILNSANMVLIA